MSMIRRIFDKLRYYNAFFYRNKVKAQMRSKLKNSSPSIIASNCIGCILSNDLGLKFNSPTVNLFIKTGDFVKFVKNLDYYLSLEFSDFETTSKSYPIGVLGDIKIYFVHYQNIEEAVSKWNERKTRIDKNNMFVMMTDRDGCTDLMIDEITSLPYPTLVFSHKLRHNKSVVYVPSFEKDGMVGELYKIGDWKGHRYYEMYCDIVKWLNREV